ncbi:MAG: UTRA domain-containing protein [Bacteroidetes bacterium]|nr:UTRA domain-containing protein [Bacteroidota bacterium]
MTIVEKDKKIPQYRQLYEILRKHILEGIYKEGDLLPSENELCIIHSMTRPTVRHALSNLVNDGFIKKQKGKGSIVHQLPKGIGILSVAGTTSALSGQNLETRILVKPNVKQWADPFMFNLSEAEKDSGCIYMERLRLVNRKPLFYDITYIPNINLPRFTSRSFENKSLFDTLRKFYQIEVKGGEQKLKAISANKEIGKYLEVPAGQPILHLERKIDTNRVGFCFYSSLYCNTEDQALFGIF